MIVIKKTPLTLAEAAEFVPKTDDKKQVIDYLRKFSIHSKEESKKLAEEIRALNNLKIKEEHIVKLIDISPKDCEDVHKVFTDVSLSEEEANAILQIFKK